MRVLTKLDKYRKALATRVRTTVDKHRRTLTIIEVCVALAPALWLVYNARMRALLVACAYAIFDGARSSVLLVPTDPSSIVTMLGALARVALMLAPVARMFVRSPRHRLAWIPLVAIIWFGVFGISVPAMSSILMWVLLVGTSVGAWFVAVRPWLGTVAFLPWIICLEPTLGHSPLGDTYWSTSRLTERCASNDGVHPVDLKPEYLMARYFGITPASSDLFLVTGERRSFWARRDANGTLRIGTPMALEGNLWQGCVRDGLAWLTCRQFIFEAPVPETEQTTPTWTRYDVPGNPELGMELDYVDAICPANRSTVYSSQLVRGGFLEFDAKTSTTTWHAVIPGLNLQFVERPDGLLAGITTSRMILFDPRNDKVLEEHPAGTVAMGIDVCRDDMAVVVTDFTGRVRLFEVGADGRYTFVRGAFYPAPRRAAFTPDCSKIAITSGNDRNVFLLRRSDLGELRSYRLGPGLRDIVFLDTRWLAAVDACTVNLLDTAH